MGVVSFSIAMYYSHVPASQPAMGERGREVAIYAHVCYSLSHLICSWKRGVLFDGVVLMFSLPYPASHSNVQRERERERKRERERERELSPYIYHSSDRVRKLGGERMRVRP